MSGLESGTQKNYSKYDNLSTAELDALLDMNLTVSEGVLDIDEELYITEVLLKRNEIENTFDIPNTEESLKNFKEKFVNNKSNELYFDYEQSTNNNIIKIKKRGHRPSRKKYLRSLVIAAIVVVLILSLSITSVAYQNIWDTFAQWAKGTLKFINPDQQYIADNRLELTKNHLPQLDDLHSALQMLKIEEPLAPNWLPDGFEPKLIEIHRSEFTTSVFAKFANGDRYLSIDIGSTFFGTSPTFEIDENSVTEYLSNNTKHYIATNYGRINATWTSGTYYIEISGDITKKELISIIDSIYEREL